ncbi:sodium:proton antiporter [Thermococci archaeon]|nr:MAG: sodium:proton antiporter [Thermococci archaeon]
MPGIIHEVLLIALILSSVAVIEEKRLVSAVIKYALMGLIFIVVLLQLRAPDVALSAIVVGAIVIGVFLYTIKEVEK